MGFTPLKRKIIQNHLKMVIQWVETHWNYKTQRDIKKRTINEIKIDQMRHFLKPIAGLWVKKSNENWVIFSHFLGKRKS